MQRWRQIVLQRTLRGDPMKALLLRSLADQLQLTAGQRATLKTKFDDTEKAINDISEGLRSERDRDIRQILTPSQREQLHTLIGPAYRGESQKSSAALKQDSREIR
jgi:hypothetical protein